MMLRLCLLLLALYKVSAQQCPMSGCPRGYYRRSRSSGTYKNGNLSFSCNYSSTARIARMIGKATRGACTTFMNQVAQHCGCTSSQGKKWPPTPKDGTVMCAPPCYPSPSSRQGKSMPSATRSQLGISLSCFHMAQFGPRLAFNANQCSKMQNIMRQSCCTRRNLRGDDDQEQGDYDEELDAESQEKLFDFLLLMEEGGERALEQEELLVEQEPESI